MGNKQSEIVKAACRSRRPIHFTAADVAWECFDSPAHRPEDLAYEKHVANIELAAAPFIGRVSDEKLIEIQATSKIKAIESKAEAVENNRSAAWLAGQLENHKNAVMAELRAAANFYSEEKPC